jgi:hypothetical protein
MGQRILATPGSHPGFIIGIYDIGSHYSQYFGKDIREIIFAFEITDERITIDNKNLPLGASKRMILSLSENSKLRKFLDNWPISEDARQKLTTTGIDLGKEFLGQPCRIVIEHETAQKSGEVYMNVVGATRSKEVTLFPENPLKIFSLDDYKTQKEIGEALVAKDVSPWIFDLITTSKEFLELPKLHERKEKVR